MAEEERDYKVRPIRASDRCRPSPKQQFDGVHQVPERRIGASPYLKT